MTSASLLLWLATGQLCYQMLSHSALKVIKNRKDPSILHLPLPPCSTALWTSLAQPMIVFVSIKATVSTMATFNPWSRKTKMPQIILTWVLKSNDLRGVCVNKMSVVAHVNFIIAQSWQLLSCRYMPTRVKGKHNKAKWMLWQESVHFVLGSYWTPPNFFKKKSLLREAPCC